MLSIFVLTNKNKSNENMNNRDTEAAPAASTTSTPTPSNPTRVGSASRSCPNHPVRVVARTTGSSSGIAVACTSSAGITAARGSTTCGCSTSTRGHGLAYRSRPRLRPRGAVRWWAAPSWGGGGRRGRGWIELGDRRRREGGTTDVVVSLLLRGTVPSVRVRVRRAQQQVRVVRGIRRRALAERHV